MNLCTPNGFLKIGGAVLLLVAILGYANVIGPTPEQSIFKDFWWFDNNENMAHAVLGVVALIAAFALPEGAKKPLVIVLGVVGVLVGLYSAVSKTPFLGANLENPADTVLHIVVGLWALAAGMMVKKEVAMSGGSMPPPPTMPTGGAM